MFNLWVYTSISTTQALRRTVLSKQKKHIAGKYFPVGGNKQNCFHRKRSENSTELEFLKSLRGLGTDEEEGYRTGPPGYIGWRNSFLGINSGAPDTFKNTGSVFVIKPVKK